MKSQKIRLPQYWSFGDLLWGNLLIAHNKTVLEWNLRRFLCRSSKYTNGPAETQWAYYNLEIPIHKVINKVLIIASGCIFNRAYLHINAHQE